MINILNSAGMYFQVTNSPLPAVYND